MADIAKDTDDAPEPEPVAVPPIDVAPSSTGVVADEHPEQVGGKTPPSRDHTGR